MTSEALGKLELFVGMLVEPELLSKQLRQAGLELVVRFPADHLDRFALPVAREYFEDAVVARPRLASEPLRKVKAITIMDILPPGYGQFGIRRADSGEPSRELLRLEVLDDVDERPPCTDGR